jgi:hypothetical protein
VITLYADHGRLRAATSGQMWQLAKLHGSRPAAQNSCVEQPEVQLEAGFPSPTIPSRRGVEGHSSGHGAGSILVWQWFGVEDGVSSDDLLADPLVHGEAACVMRTSRVSFEIQMMFSWATYPT